MSPKRKTKVISIKDDTNISDDIEDEEAPTRKP